MPIDSTMCIGVQLRSVAQTFGAKPCLIAPDRTVTFTGFYQDVVALARHLVSQGIQYGDRVAILDVNSVRHLEMFCALGVIGAIAVPLNYRLRLTEHSYQIKDSEVRLLIAGSRYSEMADRLSAELNLSTLCLDDDSAIGLAYPVRATEAVGEDSDSGLPDVDSATPLAICYTSGTTGRPKGAVIDQRTCYLRAVKLIAELHLEAADILHLATPLFHISCLNLSLMGLFRGTTQVMLHQFQVEETMAAIESERVTFLLAVPTMLSMMLNAPNFTPNIFADLGLIMYTGAAIGLPLLRELMTKYPGDLIQFLGQTEDLPQTVLTPRDHREAAAGESATRLASVGRPCLGVEIKIADEAGTSLLPGQIGEIVARGGTNMSGYWNLPEETAETLRDGWIYTGDLGYRDDQGYIYLAGRKKHMIIRGGENIYPAEVEAVLLEAPGVRDGVIIGIPDPVWGEIVGAVVVSDDPAPDPRVIIEYCGRQLASYKCPERIFFRADLPRNASGKVLRHELQAELMAPS